MSINRNSFLLAHTVGKIKTGQVQKTYFLRVTSPLLTFVLKFLWEITEKNTLLAVLTNTNI